MAKDVLPPSNVNEPPTPDFTQKKLQKLYGRPDQASAAQQQIQHELRTVIEIAEGIFEEEQQTAIENTEGEGEPELPPELDGLEPWIALIPHRSYEKIVRPNGRKDHRKQ